MKKKYDYLVIGCGLFGVTFAQKKTEEGKKVLVIEKRNHIGGNCYTENLSGINVHIYGPHIFHTNNKLVWDYVNRFAEFNNYVNRPKVKYKTNLYSFPINLMTLHQIYGVKTPLEAKKKLRSMAVPINEPANLEEWILSQVGEDIYKIFIKGYTEKQWQREARELPASLIKRLPIRFNFNDNYFNDNYQGIPFGGYTKMIDCMLKNVEVKLNIDYFEDRKYWDNIADKILYTGKLDEYFDYEFGHLEYRGLKFESEVLEGDYQGNAVINYTEKDVPFTRIIEHKHFEHSDIPMTVITREYPSKCTGDDIPYYPVNTVRNNSLYEKYRHKAEGIKNLIIGGRLATYKYLDMDQIILSAFNANEQ